MSFLTIAAGFILLLAGSTVKGLLGIGLPMVAVPGLALIVGLPSALAIVSLPVLAANLWQVWQFRASARRDSSVYAFVAAGAFGVVLGTVALVSVPEPVLELTLAALLTIYIVSRLTRPEFALGKPRARLLAGPLGLVAGVLQGATGISGPIGITFFHAQRLARPEFIFSTGAMFAGFALVQVPALAAAGLLRSDTLAAGLAGLPAIALGLWLGNRMARHVDQRVFDRLVLVVLAWTAAALFWQGATG